MRKCCENEKRRILILVMSVLSAGISHAAVPSPSSPPPVQRTVNQAKGDDWFAEIDDMIQDMVAPAPLLEPTNPPVRFETNQVRSSASSSDLSLESASGAYPIERPLVRKQVAQAQPAPTPIPVPVSKPIVPTTASAKSIDASIIEEILRSDYWLEEEPASPEQDAGPAVVDGRKGAGAIMPEVAAVPELSLPTVTAEDQLLLLERELLQDLSKPASQPALADAEPPTEPIAELTQESATQEQPAAGAEPSMAQLEEELLAELDDFGVTEAKTTPAEPPAASMVEQDVAPALAREDEQADLLFEQLALEASIASTPASPETETQEEPPYAAEVDAALARAESRDETIEEAPPQDEMLFSRVELLQVRMEEAVRRGDRDALAVLSAELADLLQQERREPATEKKKPERTVMASVDVRPETVSQPQTTLQETPREITPAMRHPAKAGLVAKSEPQHEPRSSASILASPDRHTKRFVKDVTDEQTSTSVVSEPSVELVDGSRTSEQPASPRAVERTIIVMDAEHQKTPLKQKEAPMEPSPVRVAAKPPVQEQQVVRIEPRAVQQAALPETDPAPVEPARKYAVGAPIPEPAKLGRADPVVFLRTPPSSEARSTSGPIDGHATAKARHTAVAIPTPPPVDDWDAPVPF